MRFFFNIQDTLKIQDEVGREFSVASEAVVFAKHLAADIRCLETAVEECRAESGVPNTYRDWRRRWFQLDRYAAEEGRRERVEEALSTGADTACPLARC